LDGIIDEMLKNKANSESEIQEIKLISTWTYMFANSTSAISDML
jgi:hypothetical protein